MKKILLLVFAIMVLALSACGRGELSGRFVNENDPTEYFEFTGGNNRWVTLVSDGNVISGTYSLNGQNLVLSLNVGYVTTLNLTVNSTRTTITFRGTNFVRETIFTRGGNDEVGSPKEDASAGTDESSGIPWWGWVIIVFGGSAVLNFIRKRFAKTPSQPPKKIKNNLEEEL